MRSEFKSSKDGFDPISQVIKNRETIQKVVKVKLKEIEKNKKLNRKESDKKLKQVLKK